MTVDVKIVGYIVLITREHKDPHNTPLGQLPVVVFCPSLFVSCSVCHGHGGKLP